MGLLGKVQRARVGGAGLSLGKERSRGLGLGRSPKLERNLTEPRDEGGAALAIGEMSPQPHAFQLRELAIESERGMCAGAFAVLRQDSVHMGYDATHLVELALTA